MTKPLCPGCNNNGGDHLMGCPYTLPDPPVFTPNVGVNDWEIKRLNNRIDELEDTIRTLRRALDRKLYNIRRP